MKRNLLYWRRILSVSILPVLAIAPSLVWNQPGRAQEGERAGLIDASRARQGMNSLADSESPLKRTVEKKSLIQSWTHGNGVAKV